MSDDENDDVPQFGDIVWAKVKSHPWWPGQVFDPAFASEQAKNMAKPGRILVAFYGDHTFSWLEHSEILVFKDNFRVKVASATGKRFKRSVLEALDEVCWRAQGGLQCRCFLGTGNTSSREHWAHATPLRSGSHKDVTMSKEVFDARYFLHFLLDMACSSCNSFSSMFEAAVVHGHALGIRTSLFANVGEDVVLGSSSECSTLRDSVCMNRLSFDASGKDATNHTNMNEHNWSECKKRTFNESAFLMEDWRAKRERHDKDLLTKVKANWSYPLMQIFEALQLLAIDPLCRHGSSSSMAKAVNAVLNRRNLVFQKSEGYCMHLRSPGPEESEQAGAHCVNEVGRANSETKAIRYWRPINQKSRHSYFVHANDAKNAETSNRQKIPMSTPESHMQCTTEATHEGKTISDKEWDKMDALLGFNSTKGDASQPHFDSQINIFYPKLDVHELLLEAQRNKLDSIIGAPTNVLGRETGASNSERENFHSEVHSSISMNTDQPHHETDLDEFVADEALCRCSNIVSF